MNIKIRNHYIWLFNRNNRLISVCKNFFELENRIKQELEKREKERERL